MAELIVAHAIGSIAGLIAFATVQPEFPITQITASAALSPGGLDLVASSIFSIILTTWGMILTNQIHPPACATTLIVSLGLLSTPLQATIIVVSVFLIVLLHAAALFAFEQMVGDVYSIKVPDVKIAVRYTSPTESSGQNNQSNNGPPDASPADRDGPASQAAGQGATNQESPTSREEPTSRKEPTD